MRKYKTVERTISEKKIDETLCDICAESEKDWDFGEYNTHEMKISHEYGDFWPEGGFGYKLSIDVCPICFNDKLLKYLDSIAKLPIKYEEYDL